MLYVDNSAACVGAYGEAGAQAGKAKIKIKIKRK